MEKFDLAIIGAGPGGYVAALYASRLGKRVAVIESGQLGGVCLNKGCIPTKTLLRSLQVLSNVKESSAFGIDVSSYSLNFKRMCGRKDEMVKRLRDGLDVLFNARKIMLIKGHGKLVGHNTIDVDGIKVEAQDIIIATGSRPLEVPAFEFDHKTIISSDDILELNEIPESLLIIGGGAIGCEFASIYNQLGSNVTLIEAMPEILPTMDRETVKKLRLTFLVRQGVKVMVGTKVEAIHDTENGIRALLDSYEEIEASKALICVGRKANISNIGIEELGIQTRHGRIMVDHLLRTNIPNIRAIGDVVGMCQLAHVASYEGVVACKNIFEGPHEVNYNAVPNCVYVEPELASVGITEEKAAESGPDFTESKFYYSALGKANILAKTEGMIKIIGDSKTGRILGVHILGHDASILIAEAVLAVKNNLTVNDLADTIHAHPTLPEGLMEAAHVFNGRGIHVL